MVLMNDSLSAIPIAISTFRYFGTLSAAKSLLHVKAVLRCEGFFVVAFLRMTGWINQSIFLAIAVCIQM